MDLLSYARFELAILEAPIVNAIINRGLLSRNINSYSNLDKESNKLRKLHTSDERGRLDLGKFSQPEEKPFFVKPNYETENLRGVNLEICNSINLTQRILFEGLIPLIPKICNDETDDCRMYGSSAERDIILLSELSKRIHMGTFYISEAKFNQMIDGTNRYLNRDKYIELARNGNREGILDLLTDKPLEELIYQRVLMSADVNQMVQRTSKIGNYIEPQIIADFFKKFIIPLTKEGEVEYLYQRGMMELSRA